MADITDKGWGYAGVKFEQVGMDIYLRGDNHYVCPAFRPRAHPPPRDK